MTTFNEDGSTKDSKMTIEPDDERIEYPEQPNLPDPPTEPVSTGMWFGLYGPGC